MATSGLDRIRAAAVGDAVCIGAGTVLDGRQAEAAAAQVAEFLVSPGCSDDVVTAMLQTGRTTLPGVLTPTDVLRALDHGVTALKLFPASFGGVPYVGALRGSFPDIAFMPTGGVDAGNVGDWFAAGAFAVGVAGELCSTSLIEAERFDEITARARRFVAAAVSVPR